LKDLFKKDRVQRALYVVGLIILVCVSFKDGGSMLYQHSSIGIKYWYFLVVPGFVLLYQIIFNNKYGWYSITSLYGFYFIWTIISITRGINDKSEYFIATDYLTLIVVVLILLMIGYLLYLIKPIKA
jgi:hypothetical protein